MTCRCGRPVRRCPEGSPRYPCTVRCLHESPRYATPRVPCGGWVHADGWHLCDPSTSHTQMATPEPE